VTGGAVFAFTLLGALVVYLLTLAPDLTWAHDGVDGGELITAVFTHSLPHPPGYPLYRLLTQPLLALPLGNVAYRFNLFSALTIALAAGLVALTSYQLPATRHPLPATRHPLPATRHPLPPPASPPRPSALRSPLPPLSGARRSSPKFMAWRCCYWRHFCGRCWDNGRCGSPACC
jgi:hypothetical protein